jgi:DNA polymerase
MRSAAGRLQSVRREAAGCERCPLFANATQTVFGEGAEKARMMLVGEQPGDQEDLQGRPFVGPAGRVLDRALMAAGLDRKETYVTNAVKHFKNVPRGKRRLHQKPNAGEIDRCKWWLDLEIEIVQPQLIVALGATAARSLLGKPGKVGELRGRELVTPAGQKLLVTIHPSLLLRIQEAADKEAEFARFVKDLKVAGRLLAVRPQAQLRRSA